MNTKLYTVLAALLLLGISSYAETKEKLSVPLKVSLKQACELALKHNPGVLSSRETLVQQDGVLKQAKARSRPHLSATGGYETFDDARLQSFGDGFSVDSTRWNGHVDANMTIFSGGRNYHYIKGQQAVKRSIDSGVKTSEENLLILVHTSYYAAWLADQRVSVQKEALSVLKEQLQMTKNLFDAGLGEKYDVTQAEVALANARPPLIRAENDRRRSIDRLQEIIGLPYPDGVNASGIRLQDLSDIQTTGLDLKDAVTGAMKNRPEIEQMSHDIEAAQREVKTTKWEQSPVVDIFAGYGIESDMFGSGSNLEGWSTGIKLNWDILDGGIRRGKLQQAKSKARQVEYQSTELELGIEGQVRKAYYDQQEATAILKASDKVIEQAREALKLAQNRYKAGKGTQLEVLESQLQLTRAQLEQSTAKHDQALASVHMKRAIGENIIER